MTVFRQSHSQQTRTWGQRRLSLWRNCACGVGKGRMRAGRVTYPRQEKPICAQVALFTESVSVNRDNDRQELRIAQAQARGILGSKRPGTSQQPSCLVWLSKPVITPSVHPSNRPTVQPRPTSSNLAYLTNRAHTQALRVTCVRVHNHIFIHHHSR